MSLILHDFRDALRTERQAQAGTAPIVITTLQESFTELYEARVVCFESVSFRFVGTGCGPPEYKFQCALSWESSVLRLWRTWTKHKTKKVCCLFN